MAHVQPPVIGRVVPAILRAVARFWHGVVFAVEEVLPSITLAITVVSILIQVFYRYVLDRPLAWPFEVSIYGYVWTLYLGAALAIRKGEHIRFDIVYRSLPEQVRRCLDITFNLITSAVFVVALKPVWDYLLFSYRIRTVALKLPWTYVLLVFPVFLVLAIVHSLSRVREDARALVVGGNGGNTGVSRA